MGERYTPVTVEAAKRIASKFNKDQVVIVAWDEQSNQVDMAGYGPTKTDREQAKLFIDRLRAFIAGTALVLVVALSGCTTIVTEPEGQRYTITARHSLVNNTGYDLDVFIEGKLVQRELRTGQVYAVPFGFFNDQIAVTVTAHDEQERYIGTDSLIFRYGSPEIWTVGRLYHPTDYK